MVAVFGKFTITEMFTFVKLGEDSNLAGIQRAFYMFLRAGDDRYKIGFSERGMIGIK